MKISKSFSSKRLEVNLMFNLLKAECRQFVKEKVFKLEIILSVIMTAVMIAISFLEDTNVASTMFSGFVVLGFLYPPMCGNIIFADFKQKTINNKSSICSVRLQLL